MVHSSSFEICQWSLFEDLDSYNQMYVICELIARPRRDCDNTILPGPSQPLTKTKFDKYHVHMTGCDLIGSFQQVKTIYTTQ